MKRKLALYDERKKQVEADGDSGYWRKEVEDFTKLYQCSPSSLEEHERSSKFQLAVYRLHFYWNFQSPYQKQKLQRDTV